MTAIKRQDHRNEEANGEFYDRARENLQHCGGSDFHLTFGKKRNGELMGLMPAVTQKVLTQQLRELEEAGVVTRITYNQVPPKVEYELTEYGWSLKEILHLMC